MKIEDHIKYWLDSADNDLDAAKSLFLSEKYDWCLFIGHLVLEKILKAFYVLNNKNEIPPKTHNLLKIAEAVDINLSKEQIVFLDEINDFNLEVRYPEPLLYTPDDFSKNDPFVKKILQTGVKII